MLHSLVLHPEDEMQIWVGISAGGVFHTADGGKTWEALNRGTRADFLPEGQTYPDHGQCVHCLVMAPGMPNRLYQQNHCGMYRSDDGGRQWESICISRTIAACTAATMADGAGRVSRPACRRALASQRPFIRAIRTRCTWCRSMATWPDDLCLMPKPPSGKR